MQGLDKRRSSSAKHRPRWAEGTQSQTGCFPLLQSNSWSIIHTQTTCPNVNSADPFQNLPVGTTCIPNSCFLGQLDQELLESWGLIWDLFLPQFLAPCLGQGLRTSC